MTLESFSKYKKKDPILENLYTLIHIYDGLSVLRKIHPDSIQEIVNKLSLKKVNKIWNETKNDIGKVVFHPLSIPHVVTLIKMANILKFLMPVSAIYVVLVIGHILHPSLLPYSFLGNRLFILLDFLLLTLLGFGYIGIDFMIRMKVIKYEKENEEYFMKYKSKFKIETQKLIDLFIVETRRKRKEDVNIEYEFELSYPDYTGFKLIEINDKHLFIFKRKYPTYIYTLRI